MPESLAYWLAVKQIPRLAASKKLTLVDTYGLQALFRLTATELRSLALTEAQISAIIYPDWQLIEKIIKKSESIGCSLVAYDSEHYPPPLKQIYDPPFILFAKGDLSLLHQPQLAIVGSRSASAGAREIACSWSAQLVQQGLVITSGLATGIDACAHRGALDGKGATIAVMATGIDIIYPSRHRAMAAEIVAKGGLLITEFLPGTNPNKGHFPRRNRIISGLSVGVLVVEAALKSGSLVTARLAMEQNREVFAVPGSIFNEQARGCHALIKMGAKLVENKDDILEELVAFSPVDRQKENVEKCEKSIQQDLFLDPLLANVGYETTPVDLVVSRSKLPIDAVLTRLTILELRGLVSAVPGGYLRLDGG